nr:hypothetical protein [Clostridia bacterium]
KKDMLVFSDGTKLFLPEAEAELAKLLPGCELALVQKQSRTTLIVRGEGLTEEGVRQAIKPWQDGKPRSQQVAKIVLREAPLPRTATGKVKRWEL